MKAAYLNIETLKQVRILKDEGLTFRQIGERLGINKGTAYKIYKGIHHQQVNKTGLAPVCPKHGIVHAPHCPDEYRITKKSKPRLKRKTKKYAYIVFHKDRVYKVYSSKKKMIEQHGSLAYRANKEGFRVIIRTMNEDL